MFLQDIMHQEELGLLKKEITLIYESLTDEEKALVDFKLQQTPKIPWFPSITRCLSQVYNFFSNFFIIIILFRELISKLKIGYQFQNTFV